MYLSGKWPHLKVRDLSEQPSLKKICKCCQVHEKDQYCLSPARVQAILGISNKYWCSRFRREVYFCPLRMMYIFHVDLNCENLRTYVREMVFLTNGT